LGVLIDLWFIIIALMLLAGVVLRFLPRKLTPVQLHKVSPRAAARLVSDFIESSYETDFGYPSGLFEIERATETEVAAKEVVAKGSHFTQVLRGFYAAVLSLGSDFGCIGMVIMLWIAVLLTPALLYAALTETLLKYLLRSQIIAALERSGDGTKVTFTLRGPVAMLVGQRLERVFQQPVLPTRIATLAGLTVQPRPYGTGPGAVPETAAA
jgi:hypothetical protein